MPPPDIEAASSTADPRAPSPAAGDDSGELPKKHQAVLGLFQSEVVLPAWVAAVQAWRALEAATGFQAGGKALPTAGRPKAVHWWISRARKTSNIPAGIDGDDDEREDFYAEVTSWWIKVNPAWRKEGVAGVEDWEAHGLKREDGGDLNALPAGLNGLTSMMACLWWWYRIARTPEGQPGWSQLVADLVWILTEKTRAISGKRAASNSSEEPPAKRARTA
ncbi:hypothetical protein B0H14DRAFT_2415515 [Mycena olivaceomarginata]|nr:hypothetical protein B0H14DRAFT_2415515 [Mycena olivaceomarginata]